MDLFLRVLASLNLPAALEDLSGDSIPQSIAEKARSIVQQGGLQSIEQLIRDLPELLTRNREILDEVRRQEYTEFHMLHPMIRHRSLQPIPPMSRPKSFQSWLCFLDRVA